MDQNRRHDGDGEAAGRAGSEQRRDGPRPLPAVAEVRADQDVPCAEAAFQDFGNKGVRRQGRKRLVKPDKRDSVNPAAISVN